jgi:hypothetical protein
MATSHSSIAGGGGGAVLVAAAEEVIELRGRTSIRTGFVVLFFLWVAPAGVVSVSLAPRVAPGPRPTGRWRVCPTPGIVAAEDAMLRARVVALRSCLDDVKTTCQKQCPMKFWVSPYRFTDSLGEGYT